MIDPTIQQAQLGDRNAQAKLLAGLQDAWFRMCLSLLRDSETARDATQETALRFLKLLPRFAGGSTLSTWSMGIAINVCREMRRSAGRLSDEQRVRELAAASGHSSSPDDDAAKSEQQALLRETLADLPERQREAIVLRFFEDMSVEEAAAAMNCAAGTVKATVHQALRALRNKLKQRS